MGAARARNASAETAPRAAAANASSNAGRCVAYVMSRFPKLTETFVLDEILGLEESGVRVEVFPLWREPAKVVHPEARVVVERAHFLPTLDFEILRDNLVELARRPALYLGTLWKLVSANRSSIRYLAGGLAIFPKAVSFARRMRELGVEHVHAHFASHPAAAALVVGRFTGLPWSFTAHGSDLHREQSMLREKVEEASFTVAISQYNRRFILDRVGEGFGDRVRVIHCGVDPEIQATRERRNACLEIVCVGTLHAVKGQRVLIEACAQLGEHAIDWRCHLVGDGEDREMLERLATGLGIREHVVFHGALEREAVRRVLEGVDVSVAPSVPTTDGRREGIPVVLMEAGAMGLPLVASRLSGIPEIVREGESGLLVEPGDAYGIRAALVRLAQAPELREKLGAGARAIVEAEFNARLNREELLEAFFGEGDDA